MKWAAKFINGEVLIKEDLIYHEIKDRLDELLILSAIVGGTYYDLLLKSGKFIIKGLTFTILDPSELTNIRPICFRRESVHMIVNHGSKGDPTTDVLGLGFQGVDKDGKNHKCTILISADGTFKVGY